MGVFLFVFVDFTKVNKKSVDFVFWDSHSRVFDHNVKTDEAHPTHTPALILFNRGMRFF